jgi:hypothetical protein
LLILLQELMMKSPCAKPVFIFKYSLRPRRMRDVSEIDMSVNLFGTNGKPQLFLRLQAAIRLLSRVR